MPSSRPHRYRPWKGRPPDSAAWRRVAAVFYPRGGVDALQTAWHVSSLSVLGTEKWACERVSGVSPHGRDCCPAQNPRDKTGCSVSRFNETEDDWGRLDPQTFGINKDTVVNVHLSRRKTRKSIIWNMLYVIYVRMFCFALKVLLAFSLVLLFWCHVHSTQRMWVQFHLCCSKPPKTQWCVQGNLCELTL